MANESESFAGIILKVSSLIFVYSVIQRAFGYLLNSLLAKSILQAEYGSYTFAWSIAMFVCGIFLLGIHPATARYVAYYRGKGDVERVNSVIKTGFVITVFLAFMAILLFIGINTLFPYFLSLDFPLALFTCSILVIFSIGGFFSRVIGGYRKPEVSNLFITLYSAFSVVFVLIVVLLGHSFTHILFAIVSAFLISNLLNVVYALKNYGLNGKFKWGVAKELIRFGIPVVAIDTSSNLLAWADVFIIKMFRGFSDLGVYWASMITANLLLMFSQPLVSIFSPIVAELFGKRDTKRLSFMLSYISERFFMLSLPILIIFLLFPRGILSVIFTEDYAPLGSLPLQIYAGAMFLFGLSMLFRTIITGSGKPEQEARIIVIAAIANVILNLMLVKPYGIAGASVATFCSSLFILAASFVYARNIVGFTVYKDRFTKIIGSIAASIVFVYIVKLLILNVLLTFVIAMVVLLVSYAAFLIALRALREEDVMLLEMILNKVKVPEEMKIFILNVMRRGVS